ncbi:MAG: SDR family NAD(P)-dependent oxidoreductase [Acidobacteriota bacterium]
MKPRWVLITGASSGLGKEFADLFGRDRWNLVLTARRAERLSSLASDLNLRRGVKVEVLPADLTLPEAPVRIVKELEGRGVEVSALVNNAGFGLRGGVQDISLEKQAEMIYVNVLALTSLTRLLLPKMLALGDGGVLNVASTAAFQPGPYMAVYYATKAYVLSFTEALAEEVRGSGVKVSCLAPGATETEFAAVADMEGSRLFRMGAMDPRRVAETGYDAWKRGRVVAVPGLRNRLGAFSVRLTPRFLVRRLVRLLQSPS